MSMMRIVDKYDTTDGDNQYYQFYIGSYDNHTLVEIAFGSPTLTDETKITQSKLHREEFLKAITIRK